MDGVRADQDPRTAHEDGVWLPGDELIEPPIGPLSPIPEGSEGAAASETDGSWHTADTPGSIYQILWASPGSIYKLSGGAKGDLMDERAHRNNAKLAPEEMKIFAKEVDAAKVKEIRNYLLYGAIEAKMRTG